jgi:hypothetical protein
LPHPKGPRGTGNLKFTIYAPLVPKTHLSNLKRIGAVVIKKKFKKSSNVNGHYIYMFALPWGQNRYPEDYKFHNFGRGLLARHRHAFNFSSTCAVVEKIFENWSILGSFCPARKAPGGLGP